MSSAKASSSKERDGKRGSDDTVNKDGEYPRKEDSGQARIAKKVKIDKPYYNVYIVKFRTELSHAEYHKSLFVELTTEENRKGVPISRGNIYEVQGPNDFKTYSKYTFMFGVLKTPETSRNFLGPKEKIGRVAVEKVDEIFGICEGVHPPRGPRGYTGHPDSNDWFSNVIHRLHDRKIVEFDSDYSVPTTEVPLIWMTGTT